MTCSAELCFPINQSLSVLTELGVGTKAQEGDLPKGKGRKYQLDVRAKEKHLLVFTTCLHFSKTFGGDF